MEIVIFILCVFVCYLLGDKIDHPIAGAFIGGFLGPLGVFIMLIWYALAPKQI